MGLYNFNSIWSRVGYYSLGNKTVYLLQKKSFKDSFHREYNWNARNIGSKSAQRYYVEGKSRPAVCMYKDVLSPFCGHDPAYNAPLHSVLFEISKFSRTFLSFYRTHAIRRVGVAASDALCAMINHKAYRTASAPQDEPSLGPPTSRFVLYTALRTPPPPAATLL